MVLTRQLLINMNTFEDNLLIYCVLSISCAYWLSEKKKGTRQWDKTMLLMDGQKFHVHSSQCAPLKCLWLRHWSSAHHSVGDTSICWSVKLKTNKVLALLSPLQCFHIELQQPKPGDASFSCDFKLHSTVALQLPCCAVVVWSWNHLTFHVMWLHFSWHSSGRQYNQLSECKKRDGTWNQDIQITFKSVFKVLGLAATWL